jgi:cytochrome b6-f complex iron-sulfur subunit
MTGTPKMADEHTCDPAACALRRRDFLGAAALTALALLEACGNGIIGPSDSTVGLVTGGSTTTSAGGLLVTLSAFPALAATGGVARVDGGSGRPVALVRTGSASFTAFSLVCPHQGYTVSVQNGAFYCQAHGARFSNAGVNNGGQRTGNLTSLPVTYDATAGTVTIGR